MFIITTLVTTMVFNFFNILRCCFAFVLFGIEKNSPTGRTLLMLILSLAPDFCFSFHKILWRKDRLLRPLADDGNKFTV